jgi:hypothetical protein
MIALDAKRPNTVAVRDARIADIASHAKRAFAEHVIRPLFLGMPPDSSDHDWCYRGWSCEKPGDCAYHFRLFSFPGRLIVVGDIGELILERTYDMLAWARSSIESISYFAEKVPNAIPTKEYDQNIVRAWVNEIDQEILDGEREYDSKSTKLWLTELRTEVLQSIDDGDEHDVSLKIYESGFCDGFDMPDFKNWNRNFLWTRECIKWFLEKRTRE